jgi:hypothetical protein
MRAMGDSGALPNDKSPRSRENLQHTFIQQKF